MTKIGDKECRYRKGWTIETDNLIGDNNLISQANENFWMQCVKMALSGNVCSFSAGGPVFMKHICNPGKHMYKCDVNIITKSLKVIIVLHFVYSDVQGSSELYIASTSRSFLKFCHSKWEVTRTAHQTKN